jgi:hypothetical protein
LLPRPFSQVDICPSPSNTDQLPNLRKYDLTALTTEVKHCLFDIIKCLSLLIENWAWCASWWSFVILYMFRSQLKWTQVFSPTGLSLGCCSRSSYQKCSRSFDISAFYQIRTVTMFNNVICDCTDSDLWANRRSIHPRSDTIVKCLEINAGLWSAS